MYVCGARWVEYGGCPCPPVRNNIVTPSYLLYLLWRISVTLVSFIAAYNCIYRRSQSRFFIHMQTNCVYRTHRTHTLHTRLTKQLIRTLQTRSTPQLIEKEILQLSHLSFTDSLKMIGNVSIIISRCVFLCTT